METAVILLAIGWLLFVLVRRASRRRSLAPPVASTLPPAGPGQARSPYLAPGAPSGAEGFVVGYMVGHWMADDDEASAPVVDESGWRDGSGEGFAAGYEHDAGPGELDSGDFGGGDGGGGDGDGGDGGGGF